VKLQSKTVLNAIWMRAVRTEQQHSTASALSKLALIQPDLPKHSEVGWILDPSRFLPPAKVRDAS
jgi:hypothetical protein